MSPQAEIAIGTDFLGYRIEELVGRGGMGVVYRAYDLRLKRTVALKLVTPELALDEHFRERFARETEVAMALEHPNVVPIHDAGDVDGRLYLAMRLVDGTDLRALLRAEGPLEPVRALAICRQIGSALDAAHARGLVHRDVKPSNVLLDETGHVYLTDFGLTRALEETGGDGAAGDERSVGTPAYVAPEQIEGAGPDGRADVYSLACVLFECLTGRLPFARGSLLAVVWAHLEEEPPRATEVRPELQRGVDDVLRKAMAKQPEDRYPTGAALVAAAEEGLGLRRPPILHQVRLVHVAAAVILLVAVLLVGALVIRSGTGSANARLFARANTVARVDPTTRSVVKVISVGRRPAAVAAAGRSIWVYNDGDRTVAEIDAATDEVRSQTAVAAWPRDLGAFAGPVLAADAGGAWIVGVGKTGKALLTRIVAGGREKREYALELEPRAVAVGHGAVWVAGRRTADNRLLRIDPRTGRATRRTSFTTAPVDSLAIGDGAVWVVGSSSGTLYRIDPRSGRRTGDVVVGRRAARPAAVPGSVWVGLADGGGKTVIVDPREMAVVREDDCCAPEWGATAAARGSLWRYDWPTGSVLQQDADRRVTRSVRVVTASPVARGPCLTSLAAAADAVWVTVGRSVNLSCRPPGGVAKAGTSLRSAGNAAARQHVVITSRSGVNAFVLRPLTRGVLEGDSGTVGWGSVDQYYIVRDGLNVEVNEVDALFEGRGGDFVLHYRTEWQDSGNDYLVGSGTWRIVSGTGVYHGLTGSGTHNGPWLPSGPPSFRSEGFVYTN